MKVKVLPKPSAGWRNPSYPDFGSVFTVSGSLGGSVEGNRVWERAACSLNGTEFGASGFRAQGVEVRVSVINQNKQHPLNYVRHSMAQLEPLSPNPTK